MPIKYKIKASSGALSDIWMDKETAKEFSKKELQQEMRYLAKEDAFGFLDELGGLDGLLDNIEFSWED